MSVSGLRGIVGTSLTPQLIQRFTAAYLRFLDDADIPGPLIVGRDGRDSGSDIAEQIQTIITSHGRDVFYGGILATPSLGIQIRQQQAAGGIQITASHNPLPYNGMKLYSPQGQILNQAQADQVLQNYQNRLDPTSSATESGSQATQLSKPHDPHLKALLETIDVTAIQQSAFHVLLDSNHGAGSPLGIRLLQHLNCQLTLLGETPDGQFSHPPEPTAQNLQSVAQHVLTESCDIGFCQDPDADRLALIDEQGAEIEGAGAGYLVIKRSWPAQIRTVYGDHQRMIDTYFTTYPGYYFTGDGALRDEDGYLRITGRVDDVLNVSGHRMGTAEVESALVLHEDIAEAAVVGFPHDIKGQGIYAYVTPMTGVEDSESLREELVALCVREIGPIAKPDRIQWAPGLPKTRSGKIMRRILRKIAENELNSLGDTSTLADPAVVEDLVAGRRSD